MNDLNLTTAAEYMKDDRCCGSGTCIINQDGECWCGQRWDGEKMCQSTILNEQPMEHE